MKTRLLPRTLITLAALAASSLYADEAAAWGKAADNKIYAQTLVNDVMANHSELLVFGMHAIAPGSKDQTLIACNLDRIGKKDDDDDLAVSNEGKMMLAPNLKESNKFEVQLPLLDTSGRIVGATGFVFKYHVGMDVEKLFHKALAIRAELAKKIPNEASLFQ